MNIKTRAILRSIAMIAVSALTPIILVALFQLDGETFLHLILLSVAAWVIWVIYSINLAQLESEEKIREIQERRQTMLSSMVKDSE